MFRFVHQHSTDIRITKGQGSCVVVGFNDFFYKFLLFSFVILTFKMIYKIVKQSIPIIPSVNDKCKKESTKKKN